MPKDIKMTWDTSLMGTAVSFAGNDIIVDSSLLTSVLISLFTDARAKNDDALPDKNNSDRRGWWGDATNANMPTDSVGSRMWLLEREKYVPKVLKRAEAYVIEALAWMKSEGIVKSVDVLCEAQEYGRSGTIILAIQVRLTRPDGTSESFKFNKEWEGTP